MCYHNLMLSKKTRSRYISWNILILWGLGLWVSLCTSNIYYSGIFHQQDPWVYFQNLNFDIAYNISAKREAIGDMLQIASTNCPFYKVKVILWTAYQHAYILLYVAFVILFTYSHEYLRRALQVWRDSICWFHTVLSSATSVMTEYRKYVINHLTNQKDYCISECSTVKPEETQQSLEKQHILAEKNNLLALNKGRNYIRTDIVFSSCTMLLFDNREVYRYFNDRHLTNTLLSECLTNPHSKQIQSDFTSSSNSMETVDKLPENRFKKGIVSSSPEFKKLLSELQKSHFFYPYMLQVSTSYILHLKSTYAWRLLGNNCPK